MKYKTLEEEMGLKKNIKHPPPHPLAHLLTTSKTLKTWKVVNEMRPSNLVKIEKKQND